MLLLTASGRVIMFFGRLSVRCQSVICRLTPVSRDTPSLLIGRQISMKLATNIQHESGHC